MGKTKKKKFDFDAFMEYVNTYDPKRHALDEPETILKDMIYGLGLSLDKDRYKFADGYGRFKYYLETLISTSKI